MKPNTFCNRKTRREVASRVIKQIRTHLRAHRDAEDGSITIIVLFVVLLMLSMGGISMDIMRQEVERTQLQGTLDSAVLAGAGAPAGATKAQMKAIVEDFFVKSGKGQYLNEIQDDDIISTLNSRSVSASADITMNTYLMKLSGVNQLTAGGAATAEVRTPKLEVALVLDVSGSMSGTKLSSLKVAAKEFVTTILNSSDPGETVSSVVPFSWTVAPGEGIYKALNVNEKHQYSTCLQFSDDDYLLAGMDSTVLRKQQVYTAIYGDFDNLNDSWRSCFTEDSMEIMAYSMSESALHTKIDALTADGNTSGNIGMKWGAALLDPQFTSVKESLINDGLVDASVANVPAPYNEPDTMKIVVMMGDGANTTSYYFDEDDTLSDNDYTGPNSDLHKVEYTEMQFKYAYHIYKHKISHNQSKCSKSKWECVYEASGETKSAYYLRGGSNYYSIEKDEWISSSEFNNLENTMEGFISSEALDWEDAWGRMSPRYVGQKTGNWGPWNDYVGSGRETGSIKNARMSNICGATKANGVVVYTIGFSVPENGTAESELRDCATGTLNYYRASPSTISDAFGSIAANVQNLRLTQ